VQAERLLSLAAQVAGEHRSADVLAAIVKGLAAESGVALARIWLRGPGDLCDKGCFLLKECADHRECLHLAASAGSSKDQTEQWSSIEGRYFQRIPIGGRKLDVIGVAGKSILVQDVPQDKEWILRPEWARKEGISSFAGHPLISRGQILGVMVIFSRLPVTEQEFGWLRMFADQAAVAITNAQAFEALQQAKALQEQQSEQLRQVIDLAPMHMFLWEADGSASYGNRKSAEYFGEIPQKPPMEFLDLVTHPDDAGKLKEAVQKSLARGEPIG